MLSSICAGLQQMCVCRAQAVLKGLGRSQISLTASEHTHQTVFQDFRPLAANQSVTGLPVALPGWADAQLHLCWTQTRRVPLSLTVTSSDTSCLVLFWMIEPSATLHQSPQRLQWTAGPSTLESCRALIEITYSISELRPWSNYVLYIVMFALGLFDNALSSYQSVY